MPLLVMTIADLLRDVLRDRGISERQAAAYMGVSPAAINRWVKGEGVPDPKYVWKIAELAHMPIDEAMRIAGHLPPKHSSQSTDEPQVIAEIVSRLAQMTPEEQRTFALPAIRLAEELLRAAREQGAKQ